MVWRVRPLLRGRQLLTAQHHVIGDGAQLRRVNRSAAAPPCPVGLDRIAGDDELLHVVGQARLLLGDQAVRPTDGDFGGRFRLPGEQVGPVAA